MTTRYQSWTNYETWAVALWIDNDEEGQARCRAMARATWGASEVHETYLTREESAKYAVADQIKDWIEGDIPEAVNGTLYGDLLGAAVSEVNWHEIANHYLTDAISSEGNDLPSRSPQGAGMKAAIV